jgi:hypothetical protein
LLQLQRKAIHRLTWFTSLEASALRAEFAGFPALILQVLLSRALPARLRGAQQQ